MNITPAHTRAGLQRTHGKKVSPEMLMSMINAVTSMGYFGA